MMDLWLPPKPAIIRPHKEELKRNWLTKPAKEASIAPGWSPGFLPGIDGLGAAATVTFRDLRFSNSNSNTYTYLTIPLGAAALHTTIFVGTSSRAANSVTASSVSVAGNACTLRVSNNNSDTTGISLWSVAYAGGGNVTVIVNYPGVQLHNSIVVWGANNILQPGARVTNGTNSATATVPVNIIPGAFALAFACTNGANTSTAVGCTEDADFVMDGGATTFGGSLAAFSELRSEHTLGCTWPFPSITTMLAAVFR